MLVNAGVVALYAVAVLAVRQWWIMRPIGTWMIAADNFPKTPGDWDVSGVSPGSDGYFGRERQIAHLKWLEDILTADNERKVRFEAARAYVEAADMDGLDDERSALRSMLLDPGKWDPERVRHNARVIALTVPERRVAASIFLTKVQNQLCVFTFVLLGAVAFLGALGWAAPMGLAAVAAIVFRIREIAPLGAPKKFDGGPRWMALFMTPLTGAVSAVLGLTAVAALAHLKIFSDSLNAELTQVPGVGLNLEAPTFSPVVLGLAIAFGWSAKLLDTMLGKVTDALDAAQESDASSEPGAKTGPKGGPTVPGDDQPVGGHRAESKPRHRPFRGKKP
jgi:hypothetical protein